MQLGARLRRGHSILEASKGTQIKRSPGIDRISAFECHRNDKLSVGVGEADTGGHDTDNAPRYTIDADGLPDHIRILSKPLLPVAEAEDNDKVLAGLFFVPSEEATQERMNPQGVKNVGHGSGAKHPVRGVGPGNIRLSVRAKPTDSGEGTRMLSQRPDPAFWKWADVARIDSHEPVLVRKGERPQHDRVDKREDRGVCPDPECQRQYRGQRKAG